jgi:hypothetical protein
VRGGGGCGRYQVKWLATELNVAARPVPTVVTAVMMTTAIKTDETIFDGRDAGLIVDKAVEQITHEVFRLFAPPPDARVWHLPKSGRQTGGMDAIKPKSCRPR